jgi:hypothetical protein
LGETTGIGTVFSSINNKRTHHDIATKHATR